MYIVEGNIGAGKSTFLKVVQSIKEIDISVMFEPLNRWDKNESGLSLLNNFYEKPPRWAYTLETYAMTCRVKDYLNNNCKNKSQIMERSIFSGHYCFAKNSYKSGFISELEWEIYLQWFDFVITKKVPAPKGFIYLRSTPEIAYKRVLKRSRSSENSISFDYLKDIHNRHEEFLIKKEGLNNILANVPVLVLDVNQDFENNLENQGKFKELIIDFITNTKNL